MWCGIGVTPIAAVSSVLVSTVVTVLIVSAVMYALRARSEKAMS